MYYLVKTVSNDLFVAVFFDLEVAEHYVMHQFTFMEELVIVPLSSVNLISGV